MPEIFIGQYLFRRLKEIGIETIFGVPGGKNIHSTSALLATQAHF